MKVFTLKKHGILKGGHYKPDSGGSGGKLTLGVKRLGLFLLLLLSMSIVNAQTIDNVFQSDPTGCSNADGSIIIMASGGAGPITYSIDGGTTYVPGNNFPGLSGGLYTVQIKDNAGVVVIWGANPVVLRNVDAIAIQGSSTTNASCFGVADGSVTVVVDYPNSGPTQPFNFELTDGVNPAVNNATGIFNGVAAGNYTVTVTNDNCNEVVNGLVVTEPAEIQVATVITDASCNGDSDGAITATASDGVAPYTYTLKDNGGAVVASNGTGSFTGLAGGNYTVDATDSNPCTKTVAAVVGNPSPVSIDLVTKTDIDCNGNGNGEIHVTVSGGTAPYTYYLDEGLATEVSNLTGNFANLSQGSYQVSVTDAGPCSLTYAGNPVTINEPTVLSIVSVNSSDVTSCNGDHTGVIDIVADGGTPPYKYSVDNGANWQAANGTFNTLAAGSYNVMVKDDNGCALAYATNPVVISQPSAVTITNVAVTDATCVGATDGEITITANGGTGDLFYSAVISGQAPSYGAAGVNTVGSLGAGNYDVQVKDANGCESAISGPHAIIEDDNVNPVASCKNITVQLDGTGNVNITGADVDGGSTDNCGIASLAVAPNSFDCTNIGANAVVLTVTDTKGNTATCNATVTVEDAMAPTAVCQDIFADLDGTGHVSIVAADVDNGSSDNCGAVNLSIDKANFDCTNLGANTVTLTVDDGHGNSSTCTATVTVRDLIAPTATCANKTIQLDGTGHASIVAADIDGGSTDNCSFTLTASQTDFDCTDIGVNVVVLSVEDPAGNITTCNANVTVEDNTVPVAVCQAFTLQLDNTGNAVLDPADLDGGSTDNCSLTFSASKVNFDCTNKGPNNVTLTVTDAGGNTDDCLAVVTVEDNVAPIALCQDVTVQLDAAGNAGVTAAEVDNGSSDNCGILFSTVSPNGWGCNDVGPHTVTLTVNDDEMNVGTCTSTVTVEDNILPNAVCQNIDVNLNANGYVDIVASDLDGGSTDNCALTFSASQLRFTCTDVSNPPVPVNVTLTVTDQGGNTDNCVAQVTVHDVENPVAVCQNITVQLDATGNASILAEDLDGGSSDNCSLVYSASKTAFACADVGNNNVTLTVTDPGGNTNTCNAVVTVEDNVAPTAICKDITVDLDPTGNVSIVAGDVDNGSNDACGLIPLTIDKSAFTCADVGPNDVTLTVEDNHGNISTCVAVVTVRDKVDPSASCVGAFNLDLDANGNATITAGDIDAGSTDACGIANMSLDKTSFTCADIVNNPITVTLTVEDNNGNTAQCTTDITIMDVTAPNVVCKNFDAYLDAAGSVTVTPNDIDGGSTDACGIVDRTIDGGANVVYTCVDKGAHVVILNAVDDAGNNASCNATVTVIDNQPPTAICQNVVIQLDGTGNASTTPAAVNNGSSDNCTIPGNLVLSLDKSAFTCADLGVNIVILTVEDESGNTATCTASVTVEDPVAPVAHCIAGPFIAELDGTGSVTVYPTDFDNSSTDNCTIDHMTINGAASITYTCADIAPGLPITLEVVDQSGNSHSCATTVDVVDNFDPVAVCQNISVVLDGTGHVTVTAADINNSSSDNCHIASMTINGAANVIFDCTNIGVNTVELKVIDDYGNFATCNADVTVSDNEDPNAICQAFTLNLDVNGDGTLLPADINNGSTDNCGVDHMTVSPNTFTCADIGNHNVTLTVFDASGNSSTCSAVVTVADNMAPDAHCVNNPSFDLDASGNLFLTPADFDNGSTDNCHINSMTISQQLFVCADVIASPIAITLTVEDDAGHVNTCVSNTTIMDVTSPDALCKDYTAVLDATGNIIVAAANLDNGSTDACGIDHFTVTPNTFDCSDIGLNPVTFTAWDVNGNQSTPCSATITVVDNQAPVAQCQNIDINLDANGEASIVAADIDNGSTDNCNITLSASQVDFTCTDIGANNVTLTVTDDGGNVATCVAVVTVHDNLAPTALCQDFTAELDNTGNVIVLPADVNNGSTDNCTIASMDVAPNAFDCTFVGAGVQVVTLTVTDGAGNVSTCNSNVTVVDHMGPDLTCPANDEIFIGPGCAVALPDYTGVLVATDNCGVISSTVQNPAAGTVYTNADLGNHTVEFTVTDNHGNSSVCSFTVTVTDQNAFTIDNVASTNVTCHGAGDGTITITATPSAGDLYYSIDGGANYGAANVNAFGGLAGGNYNIMVKNDNDCVTAYANNPVIIVDPAALSFIAVLQQPVNCNGGSDGEIMILVTGGHGTYDYSIDGAATWQANNIFDNLTAGFYEVWVRDAANPACNLAYPANNMEVTEPPAIQVDNIVNVPVTCFGGNDGSITVNASGGTGDLYFSLGAVGDAPVYGVANDNFFDNLTAGDYDLYIKDDHDCPYGPDLVTIIVGDVTPPVAACKNIDVELDASGNATIVAADIENGSTDNCAVDFALSTATPNTFDCSNLGANNVELKVFDTNGNSATCNAIVTVKDVTAPAIAGALDMTTVDGCAAGDAPAAETTVAGLEALPGNLTITEACTADADIVIASNDVVNGTCPIVITRTYTATDLSANTSVDFVHTIHVQDVTGPVVTVPVANLTMECFDAALVDAWTATASATDACDGATNVVPTYVAPATNCNETVTVTFTSTDACGNATVETKAFIVNDVTGPVVTVPAADLTMECFDAALVDAWTATASAVDNCDAAATVVPTYVAPATNCNETVTVTFTSTDACGNATVETKAFIVNDVTAPVITVPAADLTMQCFDAALVDAWTATASATDNCDAAATVVPTYTFPTTNCQSVVVTFTSTDACGNVAVETKEFIVNDNTAPTAVCQAISIDLDANGQAMITADQLNGGSTDNCTPDVDLAFSASQVNFDCTHVGNNTVTLTVTDECGNTSTCDATVTVNDVTAPVITCPADQDLLIGAGCEVALPDYESQLTTADACGIATIVQTPAAGTMYTGADVGVYTVSFEVTDVNGNVSNCSFNVTVLDAEAFTIDNVTYTDVLCNGAADGTITVATTGGPSGLFYSIDGIDYTNTTGLFTGLAPNTYTVSVKNTNDCLATWVPDITITEPTPLVIDDVLTTNVTGCAGNTNATIEVVASGGTPAYEYSIDNQATWQADPLFIDLAAGDYDIFVKDANGCITPWGITIHVNEPAPVMLVDIDVVHVLGCYGDLTGEIHIDGTGGTGTLSYSIDGGANFFDNGGHFTGLAAGFYFVQIMDENGCDYILNNPVVINEPPMLFVSDVVVTDVTECYGNTDGVLDISATGGTGTILYSIDGGATFVDNGGLFENIAGGDYNIFITDDNGCSGEYSGNPVTVGQPVQITMIVTSGNVSGCAGNTDGFISISSTGGTGVYTYSIDGGASWSSSTDFTGLVAGSYTVMTQDDLGCVQPYDANPVIITEPDAITYDDVTTTDLTCFESADGELMITATGGTGILTYSIDGGVTYQTDPNFFGLAAGDYTLMILDENGCAVSYPSNPVVISQPNEIVISNVVVTPNSCTGSVGSITITANGGDGSLKYSINNGANYQTSNFFGNLDSDTYIVKVKDGSGCDQLYDGNPVVVEDLTASNVVINVSPGTEVCTGTNVTLSANAYQAVSYTWNTGQTGATIIVSETSAGTVDYTCTVVNEDGCESSATVSITYNAGSDIEITVDPGLFVVVDEPVTLEAYAPDALSYSWEPGGSNDPTIVVTSNVVATIEYTVTVINNIGCETTASVDITWGHVAVTELESDIMSINVYPNPNNGEFSLELTGVSEEVKISVIDFAGRLIQEEKILDITADKVKKQFDLGDYERGIYFLRITHGEKVSYKKVVVQ